MSCGPKPLSGSDRVTSIDEATSGAEAATSSVHLSQAARCSSTSGSFAAGNDPETKSTISCSSRQPRRGSLAESSSGLGMGRDACGFTVTPAHAPFNETGRRAYTAGSWS
jgi:hypothetical protein